MYPSGTGSMPVCQDGLVTRSVSDPLFPMAGTDGRNDRLDTASHATPSRCRCVMPTLRGPSPSDPYHHYRRLHVVKANGLHLTALTVCVASFAASFIFKAKQKHESHGADCRCVAMLTHMIAGRPWQRVSSTIHKPLLTVSQRIPLTANTIDVCISSSILIDIIWRVTVPQGCLREIQRQGTNYTNSKASGQYKVGKTAFVCR